MITLVNCKDDRLRENTIEAVTRLYSKKLTKPVFISLNKKLNVNTGTHEIKHNTFYNSLVHVITLSLTDFEMFAKNGLHNKNHFQPWKELYSESKRRKHPELCWYSNILAHELQHAWQSDHFVVDTDPERYEHDKIDRRRKYGLSDNAYKHISEYDAEVHAKKYCNKIYSIIKKGF